MKSRTVYKILSSETWTLARAQGVLALAGVDARDGFVHLSAAHQVAGTLALHFSDADDLILVAFDTASLAPDLRWEASRGGAQFPHFHGGLATSLATDAWKISRGPDGAFVLPALAP